jgi:hypothetical protein
VQAFREWQYREFFLLGLIRGHWDYRSSESAIDFSGNELEVVNMGIALVTPIQEAYSLLFSEELIKQRRQRGIEILKQREPSLDQDL